MSDRFAGGEMRKGLDEVRRPLKLESIELNECRCGRGNENVERTKRCASISVLRMFCPDTQSSSEINVMAADKNCFP
jgi:hypothetical protein